MPVFRAILRPRHRGPPVWRVGKDGEAAKAKDDPSVPDLKHSKNAVVNSLAAASSQKSYGHAID
jgi:hypothetical protein